MSDMTGAGFISGAAGAGLNEMLQKELQKLKDPTLHQIASAVIGSVAGEIAGGSAQVGAGTAASGTRNNVLIEHIVTIDDDTLEQVSRLPEGHCLIMNGEAFILSDSIMIFKIGDNPNEYPVFSAAGISLGKSIFPVGISFLEGYLTDSAGNNLIDVGKIKDKVTDLSIDAQISFLASWGKSFGISLEGISDCVLHLKGISTNVSASIGLSYAYYKCLVGDIRK